MITCTQQTIIDQILIFELLTVKSILLSLTGETFFPLVYFLQINAWVFNAFI